jgi:hypothetical protein
MCRHIDNGFKDKQDYYLCFFLLPKAGQSHVKKNKLDGFLLANQVAMSMSHQLDDPSRR